MNKVRRLPQADRRRLFQAVPLLPLLHLGLLCLGYYRLRGWIEKITRRKEIPASDAEPQGVQRARELARIVDIAAEHGLYKATCLRRSVLLWWFLRTEGIPGDIRFGVHKQRDRLQAHAWVECNGVVVNDSTAVHENYQVLDGALPSTHFGL